MGQGPSTPKITAQDRAIFQMKQQRDKLKQYQKRINTTIQRQNDLAKEAIKKGETDRAKFYLRSKKHQQSVITKTYDQLDNLENLIGTIEFKLIEKDVIYGLTEGNKVLNKLNTEMSVDKIDKILDDLEDHKLRVDEVSDLLGAGNLSNNEEFEVDEELEKLNQEINGKESINLPDAPNDKIQTLPDVPSKIEPEKSEVDESQEPEGANPIAA
ncbi:vacuolar protein sorting-associated protein 20 [[Candida] jaroonii]|uniref:Vacuolar protein sorting-associated protein 20 n=1 Tax=[Candida] jaroonii TaxID=467808 RepID=A0ACA9Y9C8_9ASCO|nr:vacuolar protein sorting-associated protein 20 [[Candida] jaroonii]